MNADGGIFVADEGNCRIRKVDGGTRTITTVVGGCSCVSAGDGHAATAAGLANPRALAMDAEGALYISEFRFVGLSMADCNIRRVDPDGSIIVRVAGSGTCGLTGDGGHATSAQINSPADIALSCDGDVAFAEPLNSDIRVVAGISHGGRRRTQTVTASATSATDGASAAFSRGGPGFRPGPPRSFRRLPFTLAALRHCSLPLVDIAGQA